VLPPECQLPDVDDVLLERDGARLRAGRDGTGEDGGRPFLAAMHSRSC
jgi:hypothetical protein